jgi:glyoxylase-like metal-dependent hydrolase (beta-lactamase superfamily II)
MTATVALALLLSGALVAPPSGQSTPPVREPERAIMPLGGDLYQVRQDDQHAVFLVTPDGIVLIDPLNVDTARWLQAEFEKRFPGVPVRYVVLTHHHANRASGAGVFRETAEIVAHHNFRGALNESRKGRPDDYTTVATPHSTFTTRRTLALGGKTVELVHTGDFHAPDMTVVLFTSERMLFAVDAPPVATVPFVFGELPPARVLAWLETVAGLDFDIVVFGDGTALTRNDIAPLAEYLSRLRTEVLIGYEQGFGLETLQERVQLDAYRSLPHYAARREQIAALFRRVRYSRLDLTVAGLANYLPQNSHGYCAEYEACSAGGVVGALTVGASVSMGRRFGVQGELTLSDQFWAARALPLYEEEVVFRPSRSGVFFLYRPLRPAGFSYALLVGVSRNTGDVKGMDRVQGRLSPAGGRHEIAAHNSRTGFSAGIELLQRIGRLRLVLPVRVTHFGGDLPAYWPSQFDFNVGAGISVPVRLRLE